MSEEVYSHEHISTLILHAQSGDKEARETLVKENLPLVKSLVRRFIGKGVEYDDLVQIGHIGLMKAINGYDVSYGVRFSTYAVPLILGELRRYMRDEGVLRVSRSLKELNVKARQMSQKLSIQLGREPSVQEIAQELGCELSELLEAMEASCMPVSLEQPYGNGQEDALGDSLLNHVAAKETMDLTEKIMLRECISQLQQQERQIIVLRYFKSCTQSKIAEQLGLSQVQVSRIESRVLKKLRCRLK